MTQTRISLIEPLVEGWRWMLRMLFMPFEIGKWLVIAFAAWLAGLAGGNGGGSLNWESDAGRGEIIDTVQHGWRWLASHEALAGMIFAGVLTLLALLVLVLWVSSRAKFVFLDNVMRNQAAIAEPWKRFRKAGRSLFLFRLIAGLLCAPLALGVLGLCAWLAFGPGGWAQADGALPVAGIVGTILLGLLVLAIGLYVIFFLDAFVVPLMYRHELGVMDAWRRFGRLFSANKGWFLLCGLFVFALGMLVGAAVMVTGVMTCCLGFLLLAVPYVGTVVLLPVSVAYRAFTVAFLAQLDPELSLAAGEGVDSR